MRKHWQEGIGNGEMQNGGEIRGRGREFIKDGIKLTHISVTRT